jgi:hypothetical protein
MTKTWWEAPMGGSSFQGCFLPSFDPFGRGFREHDFLEINQSETRIACGGHVYLRIGTK